jgi:DNA polymerase-3 subunit gamma/tau
MTLYLKYRPQKIGDLDNFAARESLTKILKSGKIPHAFLFSGSRGTGKTSSARILAKALNCEKLAKSDKPSDDFEPCGECDQCLSISRGENLDVIELDAASNRGIDDIRTLRESIKLAPTKAQKKVYIIDEAHMLTVEASNAFLKTLEEPPDHVVFILATTNPEKLIPTIRSRVTNIVFHKANEAEILSALTKVAKGENVEVDKKTLTLISKNSDGSFRDAVKIFEELQNEGLVTDFELSRGYLEGKSVVDFDKFLELLVQRDAKSVISMIEQSLETGITTKYLFKNILALLQEKLLISVGVSNGTKINLGNEDLLNIIGIFGKASQETNFLVEQLPLEAAVVEWCETGTGGGSKDVGGNKEKPENMNTGEKKVVTEKKITIESEKDSKTPKKELVDEKNFSEEKVVLDGEPMPPDLWKKILYQIKPVNSSTEALLRASRPISVNNETLVLGVYYKFHKERLEERPHKEILYQTVSDVLGKSLRVVCELTEPPPPAATQHDGNGQNINREETHAVNGSILTEAKYDDIIKVAEDIFGK